MQQLIGRLTSNAKVSTLKDGREVTNFSIAINDSYKAKGQEIVTKNVTFIDCAYWLSSKIAPLLIKGAIVELNGRIGVRAYKTLSGEAKATITCYVQSIKLHGQGAKNETTPVILKAAKKESTDDLPF